LCTTFFRKIIIDAGEQPGNLNVNQQEQHLITFGSAIAANKGVVKDEIFNSVRSFYSDEQLVLLIAFAGQMIATNIFNNVIGTDIDDYLIPYLPGNSPDG
jgi:alkylhydroperoxidase family enzyme